jgi:fatty-acyl-CoA synthase
VTGTSRGGDTGHQAWIRALEKTSAIGRSPETTFPVILDQMAAIRGSAPALLSDRECLTYSALADRSIRYSRWALEQGLGSGDVVGVLMPNCPEYLAVWVGLSRVGVIVALLNTSLVGASLSHSIAIVAPKHIIVGADLAGSLADVHPQLGPTIQCWVHGNSRHDFPPIEPAIQNSSSASFSTLQFTPPSIMDQALYIYTSGTTGIPKAAKVSHLRVMQWTHWFAGMMDTQPSDRMYNCLPMYHSTGGIVAIGALLVNGGSAFIRERFSTTRFWDDIVGSGCTLFQYIGEVCRYLVNSPPHSLEASHKLRLCCGNGLQPEVWKAFQRRFRVPRILEFYAATEGTFSLYNCEGKVGAIGRMPPFLPQRSQVEIVKSDVESGRPVRGDDGFCVRCVPNETGEAIGRLAVRNSASGGRFEGYTDNAASEEKLLHNVFADGDAWFRTGDLMRKDSEGYFYFEDRIGDTFRWKGENVSTTEVAQVVSTFPGVTDAVIYGVAVPGAEGRAGMATIEVSNTFDLAAFRHHLVERLPDYSRPLFLRICHQIEMTATFKPKKRDLMRQGYDPDDSAGTVYLNDRGNQAFVRLDPALYDRIQRRALAL